MQQANFIVFDELIIAFAAGLHRAVTTTRGGIIGPALLAVSGLQLIIAGVFRCARTAWASSTTRPGCTVPMAPFFVGLIGMMMFFGGRHGPGVHMLAGLAGTDVTRAVAEAGSR